MCGITGMYLYNRNDLQREYYTRCLNTMKHRGPDSQCLWDNKENYIAGFCRLAIRDLSPNGNQPMLSDCGNYCISFNGEIYNTADLIQALRPYRTSFKSTADTEVLLYALMHLGAKATLQLTDGIFAIAFYDIKKNSLLLARDRVGIKPLYIGESAEGVAYSSQYDHIINHPYINNQSLNAHAIGSFLSLGYVPENYGAFNNTKLLLHGHYYIVQNGKIEQYSYYGYPLTTGHQPNHALEETLYNAVQSQLVSDVPLGTFMSGGVDSTLVTWYANRQRQINSFTIGVKNHKLDESETAQQFADIFKTNHHNKFINPEDLLGLIDENTKAFSEPFADFSSLPTLMLSKFTREKVTVALSGDGGDELFWGYPRNNKAFKNIGLYKHPPLTRKAALLTRKLTNISGFTLARHWHEKNFASYYYHSLFISGALNWMPRIFKEDAYEDYYYSAIKRNSNQPLNNDDDYMNVARKLETDTHLQRILLKVDRASMYHSLEVRVPLLSNNVLDMSGGYHFKECVQRGIGKINLKNSLIEKTNKALVMRPKKGFVIPMAEWMRTNLQGDVTNKILDMPSHLSAFFDRAETEQLLKQHMDGKADWSWFIWAIYSLVNWDAYHVKKQKPVCLTIGIITISFPTLSETFISNKVLHLANRGHRVIVFCDSINTKLFNKLFACNKNVTAIAFTKSKMAQYAALHPFALISSGKAKASLTNTIANKTRLHYINKYKLDILHVEFSGIGILYLPVLKKIAAKKVVSCRGSAEKVKLLVFDDRKKNIQLLFNSIDAIHCVSDDMRQTILPYCSDPSKIFVNYPSIDAMQFKRSRPYKANTPVQILSIGRFTFQKGYFTGLLAIKKLQESFTDFIWVIVGDGTQKEEIIFHIHQMGLQNHVVLVGAKNREEIIDLYNKADIFFLPSVYEGIANVALEAMAMELPVVATKSGGMQEVITHGVNGLLADVYDSDELAALLLTLTGDETKRAALGMQARARVLGQFTLEKQITIFETVYNNLINNNTVGI